jgi:hypothetical protein
MLFYGWYEQQTSPVWETISYDWASVKLNELLSNCLHGVTLQHGSSVCQKHQSLAISVIYTVR